ncbi:uncharacterized protein [Eurosta solidaginis]|uniref:uncharacterized protein isoform X2 n=1 Tax=Eurosta solidaginis TaxID=178769 RepID=UPI0035311321
MRSFKVRTHLTADAVWSRSSEYTYILIYSFGLNFGSTKVQNLAAVREARSSYVYAYLVPASRSASQRATSERPLIRYWNNFVRNIRVPVPTITWNMTNPFKNLINAGVTNVIDTPVRDYDNNIKRKKRKRSKNTRKHLATNTKNQQQKFTPSAYTGFNEEEPFHNALGYNSHQRNPVNTAIFFYDTQTGQYFKIQHPPAAQYTNNYAYEENLQQKKQQESQHQDAIADELQVEEDVENEVQDLEIEQDKEDAETMGEAEKFEEKLEDQELAGIEGFEAQDLEEPIEGTEHGDVQMVQNFANDHPSEPQEHIGEVTLVPENDEELEEWRTLRSQSNKRFILNKKPNIENLEKFQSSMRVYVIRERASINRQQTNTKKNSKYKFFIYTLQV